MSADAICLNLDYSGRTVRMVGTAEAPEWVAADVCSVLEIANHRSVMRDFGEDSKGVHTAHTPGGRQNILTVKEPGLYRLISASRKPEAEKFRSFVFGEVLPSIRKHGRYPPPGAMTVASKAQEWISTRTQFASVIEEVVGPRFDALGSMLVDQGARLSTVERHLERVPVIRVDIPNHVKRAALDVVLCRMNGTCPCCLKAPLFCDGEPLPNVSFDHWASRGLVGAGDIWPVCVPCNAMLSEPGSPQRADYQHRFRTFQDHRFLMYGDGKLKSTFLPGQRKLFGS